MSSTKQELDLVDAAETISRLFADVIDLPLLSLEPVEITAGNAGSATALAPTAAARLKAVAEEARFCQRCVLHIGRKQSVFGRGQGDARIIFVGDFPSELDNTTGEPFSDEAGRLLNKMIVAMKLQPSDVYFTNIYKCHPPVGQQITDDLYAHCERHLNAQLEAIDAPVIVALGEIAAKALARSESPLRVLRRQQFDWQQKAVFCTHHPRELLQSPALKKEAWDDLQLVMRRLEQ